MLVPPDPALLDERQKRDFDLLITQAADAILEHIGGSPLGRNGSQHLNHLLAGRIAIANEKVRQRHVLATEERDAPCRRPVASRASRLLIIGFKRRGMLIVDHGPYIRLVDSHPERDCGDGYRLFPRQPLLLSRMP